MSPGTPVRIWREASSTTAPTIANASSGERQARRGAALGVLLVELDEVLGDRLERAVAALHRARAGADDLHQQRLRLVRVARERLEEGAERGADARLRVGRRVARRGVAHRVEDDLGRRVEQRDDAVLLVAEVLVERGLRHPGLARDRLGRRLGVADAREDGGRRREQAAALAGLADLQRWGMAPPRDGGTFLHRCDGNRALGSQPPMKRVVLAILPVLLLAGCGAAQAVVVGREVQERRRAAVAAEGRGSAAGRQPARPGEDLHRDPRQDARRGARGGRAPTARTR